MYRLHRVQAEWVAICCAICPNIEPMSSFPQLTTLGNRLPYK